MKVAEVLEVALKTGEIVLCSGAEIYRVEDTIQSICDAYNVSCESFIISTGIIISARNENDEHITMVKRIGFRRNDFNTLERINNFSRAICSKRITYEDALAALMEIENKKGYPFIIKLLAAGCISLVFTLYFGGYIDEAIVAFLISLIVYTIQEKILVGNSLTFINYFVLSIVGASLSIISHNLYSDLDIYKIIIGVIMILVPGGLFASGMKDALRGDVVSSLYRFSDSVIIAFAIGSGIAISFYLTGY